MQKVQACVRNAAEKLSTGQKYISFQNFEEKYIKFIIKAFEKTRPQILG